MIRLSTLALVSAGLLGCATNSPTGDGRDDSFTTDGKLDGFTCTPQEAAAILDVVNTATRATLKNDVQLVDKATDNILAYRAGDDEDAGTSDDETFGSLGELDAVPFIGPAAFQKLLDYVHAADLVPDSAPRAWTPSATIANGTISDFTIAKNGKPAAVFLPGALPYKALVPTGAVVDLPADAKYGPQIATDSANTAHVFYKTSSSDAAWKHASYKNGSWTSHDPVPGYSVNDYLQVDNGPNGEMFALDTHYVSSNGYALALTTIAANGTATTEPLWDAQEDSLHLNVDAEGAPNILWPKGTIRHGRRVGGGWQTRDTGYSVSAIQGIATAGGANAVLLIEPPTYAHDLRIFRVQGGGTIEHERFLHDDTAEQIDATMGADGTAHACMIDSGNVVHLELDGAGNVTKQTIGAGTRCWIGTDGSDKVHVLYINGSIASHATYE